MISDQNQVYHWYRIFHSSLADCQILRSIDDCIGRYVFWVRTKFCSGSKCNLLLIRNTFTKRFFTLTTSKQLMLGQSLVLTLYLPNCWRRLTKSVIKLEIFSGINRIKAIYLHSLKFPTGSAGKVYWHRSWSARPHSFFYVFDAASFIGFDFVFWTPTYL